MFEKIGSQQRNVAFFIAITSVKSNSIFYVIRSTVPKSIPVPNSETRVNSKTSAKPVEEKEATGGSKISKSDPSSTEEAKRIESDKRMGLSEDSTEKK